MPGDVAAAQPTTVFPRSLSTAFTAKREWAMMINEYANGETQRRILTNITSSRRSWQLAKRLSNTNYLLLRGFYTSRKGEYDPFFFYDPFDVSPGQAIGANYDATGASLQGRITVTFVGAFSAVIERCRTNVNLALLEVA